MGWNAYFENPYANRGVAEQIYTEIREAMRTDPEKTAITLFTTGKGLERNIEVLQIFCQLDKCFQDALSHSHSLSKIHIAAHNGWFECAMAILCSGERDLNKVANGPIGTPLHRSIEARQEAMALWLIDNGADVTLAEVDGCTPLHYAARIGADNLVRAILKQIPASEKAAYVNRVATGHIGTALHWACANGHEEVARLLVEAGADVTVTNRHGQTPFQHACGAGKKSIAELLLAQVPFEKRLDYINIQNPDPLSGGPGISALEQARMSRWVNPEGKDEVARWLLELGARSA